MEFLSDMIRWYHSTNQNFFRINWNFLIDRMMWHCMVQQGLFKPCLHLGFWESAQSPAKAWYPSTFPFPLWSTLSPLHVQEVGHPSGACPRCGGSLIRRLQGFIEKLLLQLQKIFWRSSRSDLHLIFGVKIYEEKTIQILLKWISVEARWLRGYFRTSGVAAII